MAYRAPVIPLGTRSMGPGLRSLTGHELVADRQHYDAVDSLINEALNIAERVMGEAHSEACQDTKCVTDISEAFARVANDLHRYLESIEDPPEVMRS